MRIENTLYWTIRSRVTTRTVESRKYVEEQIEEYDSKAQEWDTPERNTREKNEVRKMKHEVPPSKIALFSLQNPLPMSNIANVDTRDSQLNSEQYG